MTDYRPASRDEGAASGTSQEKTKVALAKQTIAAGTKIDDPADFFDEVEMPSTNVPDNWVTSIDELKGKVVTRDLLKNSPVVKEAFEGDAPKTTAGGTKIAKGSKDVNRHTITFQVGGSSPYYAHFKDGKLEDSTQPPISAGNGAQPPSTEIKPPQPDNKIDVNQ